MDASNGNLWKYLLCVVSITVMSSHLEADQSTISYGDCDAGLCCDDSTAGLLTDRSLLQGGPDPVGLEIVYTGDAFTNTRGGISTNEGLEFTGLLDVVLTVDLDAAGCGLGGQIVLHGVNSHGRFLNQFVGATQDVTNIDAEPFTAMAEYFWARDVWDGDAVFRIGYQFKAQ